MSRVHRYTLICFLLAAVFILGSMAGMNFILQEKESRMLRECGTAEIESPVAVWQEPEETEEDEAAAEEAGKEERKLTIAQMEEVINYRADASEEIFHEPVTGQISMEEAFIFGESWLVEMGFAEEEGIEGDRIVAGEDDSQILVRRASLGVKKNQERSDVPIEPYYSFWTVRFSNEYMYAVLFVNAVTGKVWEAEITLYHNIAYGYSWEKLYLFIELAGIEEKTENYVEINEANTETIMKIKNSGLCGEMKYHDIQVAVSDNGENSSRSVSEEYRIKEANDDEIVEHDDEEVIVTERIIRYRLIPAQ